MCLDQLSSLVRLGRRTKVRPLAVIILDEFKGRILCRPDFFQSRRQKSGLQVAPRKPALRDAENLFAQVYPRRITRFLGFVPSLH